MFSGIWSVIFSSQTCKRLRHFAQLHQNSWANANSSPKRFSFPSPILSKSDCTAVVVLLDIAHVVAGYRELAKGFDPIRNEEIVSRYVIHEVTIYTFKLSWLVRNELWKLLIDTIFNNYTSTRARWIWVGYNHLISSKRKWNNFFTKNAHKISRILPDFICKNNRFSACF